ncbi:MAG: tRNA (N6-isopentenyl adenosine(37)-C2)-methylthiotransferase MiaB [Planctomycetota bacterium]|jgi:tRNA-2-methylthio-N6-dimethylallyladenosine synthase|nr:tRNA (N6-isopentenyl adenosine(37)-C2)-methylthiotransferase MiaB [Planctomycetota bacterium]MDP6764365.1 tRNA (N6-isopentenyl adenosine(37)-C2)-methylthiotransferase MiaB [Planctomycetota bacterium]MDP6988123.1 tRNA (N6-isopentenyl adenosine(37)-C2)-methylthiotransferase MiaB [Planctomycetota bacterium]
MSITRFQSAAADAAAPGAPRLHVVTFGCQMNKYDSLLVEGRFKSRGYATTDELGEADVVLFNTCSVRDHAEERAWSWLGELKHAKRERPELVIGVMGCMAQRVEEEVFRRAGHVDIVCGTRRFADVVDLVDDVRERRRGGGEEGARSGRILATGTDPSAALERGDVPYTGGRHGWLAVMRGCDLRCAFCIVPTTRGRVRSKPLAEVEAEARAMVAGGAEVITLLGQTVNSYGEDLPAPGAGEPRGRGRQGRAGLADVLHRLQAIDGLERLRLITLHPAYLTRELAEAVRDCDKVERFLPLPVQSGSDRVLKAMRRGYTVDLYRRRLEMLRSVAGEVELSSDWIVGFPGEEERDFEASLDLLEEVGFASSYVFKYDPRPRTSSAERSADSVPSSVKKERNARLLERAEAVSLRRMQRHLDREVEVFVEEVSERDAGLLRGRSAHGLPVSLRGDAGLVGRHLCVTVRQASPWGLSGEPTVAGASPAAARPSKEA